MSRYRYEQSHYRLLISKYAHKIIFFVIVLFLLLGGYFVQDSYRANKQSQRPSNPTQIVKSKYLASTEVFSTQYFQFQAAKTWRSINNESTASTFVYRNFRFGLVESELKIYVNQSLSPETQEATRVLPIGFDINGIVTSDSVSDHCGKDLNNSNKQSRQQVVIGGVTMLCDVDGTEYTVVVGLKGGDTSLRIKRPGGEIVAYFIYYRSLKATLDGQELQAIMDTFQTR